MWLNNFWQISKIYCAKCRFGAITIASTTFLWFFIGFLCFFKRICKIGSKNANVLPLPVWASTATSWFFKNKGIATFYTGIIVGNFNPSSTANYTSFINGGSNYDHDSVSITLIENFLQIYYTKFFFLFL